MKKFIQLIVFYIFFSASAAADDGVQWFRALLNDDGAGVQRLLQQGANPNRVNTRGDPALVEALRDGKWDAAEALMAHSELKVDLANGAGETPLMMAALRGRADWVDRLAARGASVNRPGWSPLHYAATGSDVATVDRLVAHGATVDARNHAGSTPLIVAARFGSEDVVRALLRAGADDTVRNAAGQDAAAAAAQVGRDALARGFEERQRRRQRPAAGS